MGVRAKILFYNPQSGDGMIITEDKQRHNFNVSIWEDFDSVPKAGLDVEVEIKNSLPVAMKYWEGGEAVKASKEKGMEKDISEGVEGGELGKKFGGKSRETLKASFSIEECLNNYFEPIDFLMGDPEDYYGMPKLDYFRLRRFLMTAYNDLKEFDNSLHSDGELREFLQTMENLASAHKSIKQKLSKRRLAFELVFLQNQPEYRRFIKNKEEALNRMTVLNGLEESIFPELRKKAKEIKELGTGHSEVKDMLTKELKEMKKRYVDAIHESASISEDLTNMVDMKTHYVALYFNDFSGAFEDRAEYYLGAIEEVLGYKTYEFDRHLWQKSSRSKAVQEYFFQSGIKGNYSTLTFLEYYLRNLDVTKISDEQRELFGLMEYLRKKEDEKFD